MKSIRLYACGLAVLALFAACSKDDEVTITVKLNQTSVVYSQDGVWSELYTDTPFQSQYAVFSHSGENGQYGPIYSGFTPARVIDNEYYPDNMLDHQFSIMSGGGMSGVGTPYLTAYWQSWETEETPLEERCCLIYYSKTPNSEHKPFRPQSVYVENTCYSYYTMLYGSSFSRQFAEGDYLEIVAHGVKADGTETTASFRLADCKGEDKSQWFVNDWTMFSLSSLGEVVAVYFTMDSSDTGIWGINTPTYFALDEFSFTAVLPD